MRVERLPGNPIIRPHMDGRIGDNINGPSLIRVPDWVTGRLGRYYLYFADHKGDYIRLAYADDLGGPWQTYEPGSLQLADSAFPTEVTAELAPGEQLTDNHLPHVASPDVHVDEDARQFRMYFHGMDKYPRQLSRVALADDGIHFKALPDRIGHAYFRVFRHGGWWYAMGMPGVFYRSKDGLTDFERGPTLFENNMRHSALLVRGDELLVFWTRVGDAPESILLSRIDLAKEWQSWSESAPEVVLQPETDYEGANLPAEPSVRGKIYGPANQLRDPAIFEEDGRVYLLYSVAGESGIAIAALPEL